MSAESLPAWDGPRGGSGCDADRCPANDQYVRVLSREEIERVYVEPDVLPQWPLPEGYTHMCTRCGHAYSGYTDATGFDHAADVEARPAVPIDAWDWSPEDGWDQPVRTAVQRFVECAPRDDEGELAVTAKQIVEGVDQHVPGASASLARDVLADSDLDVSAAPADDYL